MQYTVEQLLLRGFWIKLTLKAQMSWLCLCYVNLRNAEAVLKIKESPFQQWYYRVDYLLHLQFRTENNKNLSKLFLTKLDAEDYAFCNSKNPPNMYNVPVYCTRLYANKWNYTYLTLLRKVKIFVYTNTLGPKKIKSSVIYFSYRGELILESGPLSGWGRFILLQKFAKYV
jgi:hypothetical protein